MPVVGNGDNNGDSGVDLVGQSGRKKSVWEKSVENDSQIIRQVKEEG